jgi:DNA-binding response OmpR family regulator
MRTILVLDADPAFQLDLSRALGDDQVLSLDSLDAARSALMAVTPDLIVSSTELPDGTGYELCRLVRTTLGNKVPVLLLAPRGVEPMSALLAGADDVVAKPVSADALRLRCARLLRQVRRALEV